MEISAMYIGEDIYIAIGENIVINLKESHAELLAREISEIIVEKYRVKTLELFEKTGPQ